MEKQLGLFDKEKMKMVTKSLEVVDSRGSLSQKRIKVTTPRRSLLTKDIPEPAATVLLWAALVLIAFMAGMFLGWV